MTPAAAIHQWLIDSGSVFRLTDAQAAELASAVLAAGARWQPIDSYPPCPHCEDPSCDWGPLAVLRVLTTLDYLHGPTDYVGRREGGMWLSRSAHDPVAWSDLHAAPSFWMPLPGPLSIVERPLQQKRDPAR